MQICTHTHTARLNSPKRTPTVSDFFRKLGKVASKWIDRELLAFSTTRLCSVSVIRNILYENRKQNELHPYFPLLRHNLYHIKENVFSFTWNWVFSRCITHNK